MTVRHIHTLSVFAMVQIVRFMVGLGISPVSAIEQLRTEGQAVTDEAGSLLPSFRQFVDPSAWVVGGPGWLSALDYAREQEGVAT